MLNLGQWIHHLESLLYLILKCKLLYLNQVVLILLIFLFYSLFHKLIIWFILRSRFTWAALTLVAGHTHHNRLEASDHIHMASLAGLVDLAEQADRAA